MPPKHCAVISVGTNSCRFLLASQNGRVLRPVYHESRGTRIGEGVGASGRLDHEAMARTLAAVSDYAALARGVAQVFGIGTSALRDAANASEFSDGFAKAAGVPLTILSGDEEAVSSFAGAVCGLMAAGRPVPDTLCVVDVGGGSTEIAMRAKAGDPPSVASLQIGAVRLTEKYLAGDPPTTEEIQRCRVAVRVALEALAPHVRPRGAVIAVGGTANTAAKMLDVMDEGPSSNGIAELPAADVAALLKATLAMPTRERLRVRGLPAQRADIFPAGLMILDTILSTAAAARLLVSQSDLLLGYAAQRLGIA